MKLETERLILRELTMDDLPDLYAVLSDPVAMCYYPAPFSMEKVKSWIEWNIDNYKKYGFGLNAVVLKETGKLIGDCGITMQNIDGELLPEIGYHILRSETRKGYATEAARAFKQYAFDTLKVSAIYSYQKYTNVPSQGVAIKNGMRLIKQYDNPTNTITTVYCITREEYLKQKSK